MKITGNDLLGKNACGAGVAFYLHNHLQDVDWDAVKKIELAASAHREHAEWLCGQFGLTMNIKTADGHEASYENGNRTRYRYSDGYETWREYDGDGNQTHYRNSNGFEKWREYDAEGNQTHFRDSNGFEMWWEYDGGILISATVKGYEPETLDDSVLEQLGI